MGTQGIRRSLRFALMVSAGLAFASSARADIDLTGRWYNGPGDFAQIVQTGSDVTVAFTEDFSGPTPYDFNMTGTFNQTTLSASDGSGFSLTMSQQGAGARLAGYLYITGGGFYPESWTRCECYDGNSDNGDGCDSRCQIEECFSCTPEPSTCVPLPDTNSCDDKRDCTTGSTCTAGVCGSGTTVPSCIDMTGTWRLSTRTYVWVYDEWHVTAEQVTFEQHDGVLTGGNASGPIDTSTGQFHLSSGGGGPLCSQSFSFDGVASSDNLTFTGEGATYFSHIRGCWVGSQIEREGYRCSEETGCDLSSCENVPESTACSDLAVCSTEGTCMDGTCVGRPACPLCTTCDGAGGCIEAPMPDCTTSLAPEKGQMQLKDSLEDEDDDIRWKWKAGPEVPVERFGDPETSDDVALCVFSGPEDARSLVAQATLDAGYCNEDTCWSNRNGKLTYKPNGGMTSAFSRITMKSGAEGKTSINVRASGTDLSASGFPAPPLTTPLRTQLQISNGSCFEIDFEDEGVKQNADGSFRARGTATPE